VADERDLLNHIEERVTRFEAEVKEEISKIKDTLMAQAVTQSKNETILATLVAEVKSFRTEFMELLTASIQAQQKQNTAWHDTAVKIVLALLVLVSAAYGVTSLVK
jgi:hypothetical protein